MLFWNHDPCDSFFCPVAGDKPGLCQSCRHRAGADCGLTRAPLPESGGCCHWNVAPGERVVRVTPAMVAPLAGFFDRVRHILAGVPYQAREGRWLLPAGQIATLDERGIPYETGSEGLWVEPDRLVLTLDEPVTDILDRLETPYRHEPEGVVVDVADLQLPVIYGLGIEE
ncbi:MAG TPA: hypothetical protein PKE64_27725 [Anaerolineae bacterium]|nr:hypothetical protein [Anaerolineae bacterium]